MKTILRVWLIACLVSAFSSFASADTPPPARAPAAAPQTGDPALILYRQLIRSIRSHLARRPEVEVDATKALSLEDCLSIALRNSGDLLIKREKLLVSKMKYTEARRDILPAVTFKMYLREGNLTSKTFKGMNYKAEGEYDALDGNHKFQLLEEAKKNYLIAKQEFLEKRDNILYETRRAYYQLNNATARYVSHGALLQAANALQARAKDMLDKELLRNVDFMAVSSRVRQLNVDFFSESQQFTDARMALCKLLHAYPENPIVIQPLQGFRPLSDITLARCLEIALTRRHDLLLGDLNNMVAQLDVAKTLSSTGLNATVVGHFGHKGEAFNEAVEGIQTRPDLKLDLDSSMPVGMHTLKYEPEFVKEVPNVGSTTSTLYNSHDVMFELFNNWRKRQIMESRIKYHEDLESLQKTYHDAVTQVATRFLTVQRSALGVENAGRSLQLAEERLKVIRAGAGAAAVAPGEELGGILGVHGARNGVLAAQTGYLSAINDLNQALGVDNFYDPFAGAINEPTDQPFRRIKRFWEFWRDDDVEQDEELMPKKFYEDYL